MVVIKLDIISDTCCPFCYVAERRIAKAVTAFEQRYKEDSVIVNWRPFLLRPDASKEALPLSAVIEAKLGRGSFESVVRREAEIGRETGIKFNPNRMMGNTFDSHRLISLAGRKSKQTQSSLMGKLMQGHFEAGRDVASHEFLIEAASEAGMDGKQVRDWLKTDAGEDEVKAEVDAAVSRGVRAVPNITIADKYPLSGYYDEGTILEYFERVRRENGA